jgi:hypothetical protein
VGRGRECSHAAGERFLPVHEECGSRYASARSSAVIWGGFRAAECRVRTSSSPLILWHHQSLRLCCRHPLQYQKLTLPPPLPDAFCRHGGGGYNYPMPYGQMPGVPMQQLSMAQMQQMQQQSMMYRQQMPSSGPHGDRPSQPPPMYATAGSASAYTPSSAAGAAAWSQTLSHARPQSAESHRPRGEPIAMPSKGSWAGVVAGPPPTAGVAPTPAPLPEAIAVPRASIPAAHPSSGSDMRPVKRPRMDSAE